MSLKDEIFNIAKAAWKASKVLVTLNEDQKKEIIRAMADAVDQQRALIIKENKKDLAAVKKTGAKSSIVDRLTLTDERIDEMVESMRAIAKLPDPAGSVIQAWDRPNGLRIEKLQVPLGVVAFIYESRPNVTSDAVSLCLKSANSIILRGGKEAMNSNKAIVKAMREGGTSLGLPEDAVQLIKTIDRDAVKELIQIEEYIDLVIPRGGVSLINAVVSQAKVPVLKHFEGICHIYVHEDADLNVAVNVSENAKCQRPGVCNSIETLLVHENIAETFLPLLAERLKERGVLLKGDKKTKAILPDIEDATDEDWKTEYLDLILSIKVVSDIDEAIYHINKFGSRHTDSIVSTSKLAQDKFIQEVDSGTVLSNVSTRFADGAEFGLGAEIGISTDKLHARGPMGVRDLTTYKYVVRGEGQVRE